MITKNFVTPFRRLCFSTLVRACHTLHVPSPPFLFVTYEVFERTGEPALFQHEQARSYNRNYYNLLCAWNMFRPTNVDPGAVGFGAGSLKLKDLSGDTRTGAKFTCPGNQLITNQVSNSTDDRGIVVGTNGNAFSFEGTALGAPITNGGGAGQLTYAGHSTDAPTYNSETKKWTRVLYRDFTNNSGGTIDVAESALYWYMNDGSTQGSYMFERNVPVSAVSVADGRTLRVTYTIELTFPA